ncbi:MAG: lipopolysaccharide transport periplasmic protein LptA [Candidatus Binatia bacterium]
MIRGLYVLAVLLTAVHVYAVSGEAASKAKKKAEGKSFEGRKKEPIVITSDRMEVNRKKNTISYKGHVVAVWGGATLKSETLTANYDTGLERINEVVARGKVRVTQGKRVATGGRAVFKSQENTITLMDNPLVSEGKNRVSGSRIILFISEDRVVVEGGAQRVKAVIFPGELEKRDKE